MTSWGLIGDLIVIFLSAGIGAIIAKKLKQPVLVGYLMAGVVLSLFLQKTIPLNNALMLADLGLAFLMFTVGLDFSFSRLARVKSVAVLGSILQMVICAVILGFFTHSIIMGLVFSLSSTAIVVKVLSEKGELDTLPSEIMIGWLLVQDLAVVPILVIVNQVGSGIHILAVLLALIKSIAIIYVVLMLGKRLIPKFMDFLSSINSREVMLLTVVGLVLLFSSITSAIGLSFALGAFLAGILVADSVSNHAIISEIRPLRDIFAVVFFTTLGLLITPEFIFSQWMNVLLFVAAILVIKLIVSCTIVLVFKYHIKTAIQVGLGLTGVGEFAFVVARSSLSNSVISPNVYALILAVTIVSMLMVPGQIHLSVGLYQRLKNSLLKIFPQLEKSLFAKLDSHHKNYLKKDFTNHIVICGHGRVGRHITRILSLAQIPFVVIDYDHANYLSLANEGIDVILGDPTDREILLAAGVKSALGVVIAVPDRYSQELIIQNSLSLHPGILIICRSHFDEDHSRLYALGAATVISPEFEAGLSMGHKILDSLGFDKAQTAMFLKRVRKEQP